MKPACRTSSCRTPDAEATLPRPKKSKNRKLHCPGGGQAPSPVQVSGGQARRLSSTGFHLPADAVRLIVDVDPEARLRIADAAVGLERPAPTVVMLGEPPVGSELRRAGGVRGGERRRHDWRG